jgi:endonuclease-3 related protein
MPTLDEVFADVCSELAQHFDRPTSDFEGLEPFEAIIAVLLERKAGQARWKAALDALGAAGLLVPEGLAGVEIIEILDALRETGPDLSAKTVAPLKHLAQWLVEHHGGRVDSMFNPDRSTGWLRGELAAIKGIGMADADAILLYALKRPSYPVDRATYRVLVRHGWLDPTATYDEARDALVDRAVDPADVWCEEDPADGLADLAHDMEQLGRQFCRAAAPRCDGCPLEGLLPEGGPRGGDD